MAGGRRGAQVIVADVIAIGQLVPHRRGADLAASGLADDAHGRTGRVALHDGRRGRQTTTAVEIGRTRDLVRIADGRHWCIEPVTVNVDLDAAVCLVMVAPVLRW